MKKAFLSISYKNKDLLKKEINYIIDTLKESGFKFKNPNADKTCGCGKSFSA